MNHVVNTDDRTELLKFKTMFYLSVGTLSVHVKLKAEVTSVTLHVRTVSTPDFTSLFVTDRPEI